MRFKVKKQDVFTGCLYARFRKRPDIDFLVSTGILVDMTSWERASKSRAAWDRYVNTDEGKRVQEKMNLVNGALAEYELTSNDDKDAIERIIRDTFLSEHRVLQHQLEEIQNEEQERRRKNIIHYYDMYLEGIQSGAIRHGGNKKYTKGSIKGWKEFRKFLVGFVNQNATFDDIDKRFASGFVNYLEQEGLMPSTVRKHVITMRRLCNAAAEDGLITNMQCLKVWKEHEVAAEEKRAEIYLTDEELDALYKMYLTGREEAVRDIFMLGYLSCQRFSDYGKLTRDNFIDTGEGVWVISVKQEKTGTNVEVPILDDRVMEIAEKYNFKFPRIDLRRMNDNLRTILKRLSAIVPSLAEKYVTQLTAPERRKEQHYIDLQMSRNRTYDQTKDMKELRQYAVEHNGQPLFERNRKGEVLKQKWELVTTHTARRSGVTNLYKTGLLDTREMMSISGHKSEKVFEKYIKMSTREKALRVAEKLRKAKANK